MKFFTEALPRIPEADVPRLRLRLRFTRGAADGVGKAEKAGGGANGGLGGGGAGRLQ